ncbi:MAG TPA: fructosamine kinase family protein [Nakamurella sp.]
MGHEAAGWPAELPPAVESRPLRGGMICTTTLDRLADGRDVVVKRCPYPAEVEAEGLLALAAAGAPTPAVLGTAAHVLVLEFVHGPPAWADLGRAMARVHRATSDRYGWHRDNPAGRFDQQNDWCDDWPTFFVQRRILAHLDDRAVPAALADRLRRACAGPLPELLPDHPAVSLTHGDLWFGNVVDGCWIVDPAVCFADRELDLAFMQTGGLPDQLFDAYQRELPFEPGYERRRPALALHKMLVGLRHFGSGRLPRIEAVLEHYSW